MSKSIKVIVKDKSTIVLCEDALKGDYIDLREINELDTSWIEQLIETGRDQIYNKKFAEYQAQFKKEKESARELAEANCQAEFTKQIADMKLQYNQKVVDLEKQLQEFENKSTMDKDMAIKEEEKKYNELHEEYIRLQAEFHAKVIQKEQEAKQQVQEELMTLKNKLDNVEKEYTLKVENEVQKVKNEKQEELTKINEKHYQEILEKNDIIHSLKNQKASLNVKRIGEDLESWCNNEVSEQMQNGFFNCTWKKDNVIMKDDEGKNGTKADYIFQVFATEEHNENELLTSICLDMKDENPDSINKQSNEHYYKTLDKNRNKKNCKYAVLVSNLESDKPNALPIFKVREYPDMYVVRPGYLMTFLHMITSLSVRFKELILKKEAEKLELKSRNEFIMEFEKIKATYLDKPLESLVSQIEKIQKNNEAITKASEAIQNTCGDIITKYINGIKDKIDRFDAKLGQNLKKFDIE